MRKSLVYFLLAIQLVACRDKIICPAFQSTYILDESTRSVYYSYLWKLDEDTRTKYLASAAAKDSTNGYMGNSSGNTLKYYDYVSDIIQPREEVRRSKYGIVKYEPMWLKNYHLKSAPMENVLGPKTEVIQPTTFDTGEFLASDFSDSVSGDSTMFVRRDSVLLAQKTTIKATNEPVKKEVKYLYRYDPDTLNNVEQEYYNKYYGKLLVDYSEERRQQASKKVSQVKQPQPESNSNSVQSDSTSNQPKSGSFLQKRKKTTVGSDEDNSTEKGQN